MKEHKILENKFIWIPKDKRVSKFGGGPLPPRKPETRIPVFWLAREGGELYFVNSSDDVLDSVIAKGGGFQTMDDDVMSVGGTEYRYKNVKPNNAVKVEEYDGFYDLDFVLQVSIKIQSENTGCIKILSPCEKGGVGETVLLWNTGEHGKNVSISKCK